MPSSSTQSMHAWVMTRLLSRILRAPISPTIVWPARAWYSAAIAGVPPM
jgi:hypothetical protein